MRKSILERAEIGNSIDEACESRYSLRMDDLTELRNHFCSSPDMVRGVLAISAAAYDAGFYAGISCAINRGFSKKNDPRKKVSA